MGTNALQRCSGIYNAKFRRDELIQQSGETASITAITAFLDLVLELLRNPQRCCVVAIQGAYAHAKRKLALATPMH